jgi:hypothetical protein
MTDESLSESSEIAIYLMARMIGEAILDKIGPLKRSSHP